MRARDRDVESGGHRQLSRSAPLARSLVVFPPNVIDPWLNADILNLQRAETRIPVQYPLE